mmetsp:Transcript_11437/g.26260  ORF Transcript_11437/g.26260 Transcript_11437/m.26260 type:complete len:95 (-) Transcript_11437:185-469(-)
MACTSLQRWVHAAALHPYYLHSAGTIANSPAALTTHQLLTQRPTVVVFLAPGTNNASAISALESQALYRKTQAAVGPEMPKIPGGGPDGAKRRE